MDKKNYESLVNLLNSNVKIKDAIHKAIFKYFGINTNMVAKLVKSNYVELNDTGNDVDNKMRGNKLLRSVFSSVNLWGSVWQEEETDDIYITLHISYKHPSGGGNGLQIGRILIHKNGKYNLLKF